MNLAWWLERANVENPQKVAVINAKDDTKLSYHELNSLSNRIGNVLKEKFGVKEDEVVSTLMPDNSWHMATLFGILKIGAIFNGLNPTQTLDKFLDNLRNTNTKILIITPQWIETAEMMKKEIDNLEIIVCGDNQTKYNNLKELIIEASNFLRITPRCNDDVAAINFTSGTTGAPKGVMFTHGTLGTSVLASVNWNGIFSHDVIVATVGLFHSGGISDSVRSVMARATLIWMEGFEAELALDIIDKYGVTWFHYIVPTMVRDMASKDKFKEVDLNGIKATVAGEPVPIELQEMMNNRGMETINLYGCTECMPNVITLYSMYYKNDEVEVPGSSGKPNKEFVRVKLVDIETGEEIIEPRQNGEICVKGDVLTPGYYNQPEKTKEAFDEEGWFHTRDLGFFDEGGNFFIIGRTDDMILTGAEKLSLLEIERALSKHPLIKDAACVGVPHARFGQSPAAFLVPNCEISEEELKDEVEKFLKDNLEGWKKPRLYVKVDEIPRTLTKKTKIHGGLKKLIEGVNLAYDVSSVSMGEYKKFIHQI